MSVAPRAPDEDTLSRAVADALEASELRDDAAAVVIDVDRGSSAHWRADEDIYPASIVKLALMAEASNRFASGSLSPDDPIIVARSNITANPEPSPLVEGAQASVSELVALMIERSDNIATNQLIDVLDRERVTSAMRALGLARFRLGRKLSGSEPLVEGLDVGERNSMRPSETAQLLRLIADDAVPGAVEQRALLVRCTDGAKLAAGVARGDRFMHKTGVTSAVNHDAGILQTADGRRFVIVLYTRRGTHDSAHADARMASWMRVMRGHLNA
ncbi:MAG TPA: serine hydrolase [Candidatus Eremiobacteraceae bacterium]|nr:serine hydrolase [Candidatus Eremiobacteraceae bacterium]